MPMSDSIRRRYFSPPSLSSEIIDGSAQVFRITHVKNVRRIVKHGMWSKGLFQYPKYTNIGSKDIIWGRDRIHIPVAPRGKLGDYVSFYFTPRSPMLHRILLGKSVKKRKKNEIVFFVSSLARLTEKNVKFVFSDRHVSTRGDVNFYRKFKDAENLDWKSLGAWTDKLGIPNPFRFHLLKCQAEALVYRKVPAKAITRIVVFDESTQGRVIDDIRNYANNRRWLKVDVCVDKRYYE